MSTESIISIITLGLSLMISLIGVIIAVIKNLKGKKWSNLQEYFIQLLGSVYEINNLSTLEKKNRLLESAKKICEEQGILFDSENVSKQIDELIALIEKEK